jgi:hypothetical protein
MSVDTRSVQGRRILRFTSFDAMMADAEMLTASPATRMLGNWPLSQLLLHLATTINRAIDGTFFEVPWYVKVVGSFIKGRVLQHGMRPGFRLPPEGEACLFPEVQSSEEALEALRTAVGRLKTERMTARHPVLGRLTHEEWTRFHLRHAEMHLGFAVLEGEAQGTASIFEATQTLPPDRGDT